MNPLSFNVSIASRGRTIVAIDEYAVYPGAITFLFGESGIGKSMVAKAVYGLLDPGELQVTINNRPYQEHLGRDWTRQVRTNGFFVFQEPSSHLNPLMKITRQMGEGSLKNCSGNAEQEILDKLWQNRDADAIREILDIFPKPYRPSGGEKQRVLLAMAFKKIDILHSSAHQDAPACFIFDEPTGSLDDNYRNVFLELLFRKYRQRAFTIILITHDYSTISEIYRSHRDLLDRIHFKELSRVQESQSQVVLKDFSPQEYISWLHGTTPQQNAGGADPHDQVVRVRPRFSVFGRNLTIFKDASRTQETDLVINRGEMVYLKAPSGVGKTTLAKILMGLYRAQNISIQLCGLSITKKTGRRVWERRIWGGLAGMVFQHADEALNLQSTVRESFYGLPLKRKCTFDQIMLHLSSLFDSRIDTVFLRKKVAYLSGGQKQRLNLLRTLILSTDLVILDEPLNGLDFASIKKVLALIEEKRAQGAALLMISHNEEIFDHLIGSGHVYYLAET
jgi:peptide/nickel transport system ATP-binding protein